MKVQRLALPTSTVLQRLAKYAPYGIAAITKPGPCCVLATQVGLMTLERFGIQARPYVAEVEITNLAWQQWIEDGAQGGIEEQQRRGAYILNNSASWQGASFYGPHGKRDWDGHLVIQTERTLIDLDLGKFSRPDKQIILPPSMIAPLRDDDTMSGTCTFGGHATHVSYRRLTAAYSENYMFSKDWIGRKRYTELVTALERRIWMDDTPPPIVN